MRVTRGRERKIGEKITLLKEKINNKIAIGKTIREIANEYGINECTLGFYIRYWKTGVKGKPVREHPNRRVTPVKKTRFIRVDKKKNPEQGGKRFKYYWTWEENSKEMACIIAAARTIHWSIFIKNVEKIYIENFERITGHKVSEDKRMKYFKSVNLEGREVYFFTLCKVKYVFY